MGRLPFWPEAQAHRRHEEDPTGRRFAGRVGQTPAFLGRAGHGLFHQHVLAGLQRGDSQFNMGLGRRGDVHDVNGRVCQEFGDILVGAHLRHVQPYPVGIAHVAADSGKVAIQVASAGVANGTHRGAGHMGQRLNVGRGHESQPQESELQCHWL